MSRRSKAALRLSYHGDPREAAAPPTEQTVRKLRRDVIERLERDGRLRAEQVRAAMEIRRIWEALGRGLFPVAAPLDVPRQSHWRGRFRDPVDRLGDVDEIIWRTRYRPWAREMAIQIAAGAARVSRLQLVLDVVVDNHGLRQVERDYRMRNGLAIEHLRGALHRYAVLSRWL